MKTMRAYDHVYRLFLFVGLAACDDFSPFINNDMESSRRDLDKDGVPNVDDCAPEDPQITFLSLYNDLDGDGFGSGDTVKACSVVKGLSETNTDCDDTNKFVNPEATEICNDVDDNCDKIVDDDATDRPTWFKDEDKDEFGNATKSLTQCKKPVGYVADSSDCNDANKNVRPTATEVCNGIDDNCDGITDDNATDKPTWYHDLDKDGYGDAGVNPKEGVIQITSCTAPAGYVSDKTDCNDDDESVHPGADEICNDIDDDCNEVIDEDAIDAPAWYADKDQDGFGDETNVIFLCTKPSGYVAIDSDCNDVSKLVHPNAKEVCNGIDDDCDNTTDTDAINQPTWYADVDKDGYGDLAISVTQCDKPAGYVADSTDCDDLAKDVHPNAAEVCNGIDDDCDGGTDEIFTTVWYEDNDNDLFGNPDVWKIACNKPMGHVDNKQDCDDNNPSINPTGTEICDNKIDEDCNGIVDDGATASKWYIDMDGDGAGNPLVFIYACMPPSKHVSNTDDCNDFDPSVNPGVAEACGDQIDNNCNGVTDTDAVDALWYEDKDEDGYGNQNVVKTACAPPVGFVGNDLDCDDSNNAVNPIVAEICNNGIDDNCDESANECFLNGKFTTAQADTTITDVSGPMTAIDADDDGVDDLAIGNRVFFGPLPSGTISADSASVIITGASGPVAAIDANDDGVDDLAIGNRVFFGPLPTGTLSADNANINIIGASGPVAMIDANDDGKPNLLIVGTNAIYIFMNPIVFGTLNVETAGISIKGAAQNDEFGSSVAILPDFNDDGKADLCVGAKSAGSAQADGGRSYLFTTPISAGNSTVAASTYSWKGSYFAEWFGSQITGHDFNQDGLTDILVAGKQAKSVGKTVGCVFMIWGTKTPVGSASSTLDPRWCGTKELDFLSILPSQIPDLNYDSVPDIVIGASGAQTVSVFHGIGF